MQRPAAGRRDRRRLPARRSTRWSRPLVEEFAPDWVLISAGLRRPPRRPAHRARPLRRRLRGAHRAVADAGAAPGRLDRVPRGRLRPRRRSATRWRPASRSWSARRAAAIEGEAATARRPRDDRSSTAVADLWRSAATADRLIRPGPGQTSLQEPLGPVDTRWPADAAGPTCGGRRVLDLDNLLRESVRTRGLRRPHQGRARRRTSASTVT